MYVYGGGEAFNPPEKKELKKGGAIETGKNRGEIDQMFLVTQILGIFQNWHAPT